jgi:FkbM family methyltransferase
MNPRIARAAIERFPRLVHRLRIARYVLARQGERELGIIGTLVEPGTTCVDVGAHVGYYAEVLSRRAGTVLAVEANPELVRYLRRVCRPNVEVIAAALSDRAGGRALLRIPSTADGREDTGLATIAADNTFAGSPVAGWREVAVATETVDTLCAGRGRVSVIKIDVEGHEDAVVRGAAATIENWRPSFMIEVEARHNPRYAELFEFLRARDYRAYRVAGDLWREVVAGDLEALQGSPGAHDRGAGYVNNFFFVPGERTVPGR